MSMNSENDTVRTSNYYNDELISQLRLVGMIKRDRPEHKSLARASVLVPLFLRKNNSNSNQELNNSEELHVLLTQRPQNLRTHGGEVCFPGGKQDVDDNNDDIQTAIRETYEEVGIQSKYIKPICRLETLESYTGLCVTPIIALIEPYHVAEPSNLNVAKAEVDAAFTVPLTYFINDNNLTSKYDVEWRGGTFEMRTYHYNDIETNRTYKVWGLTAYIAYQVAKLATTTTKTNIENCTITGSTTISSLHDKTTSLLDGCHRYPGHSGYLYRLINDNGRNKPYWVRRYFVLDGNMVHQYDGERQARRKSQSASKKNRLQLIECNVKCCNNTDSTTNKSDHNPYYEFIISTLSGRIEWHVAAESESDREQWIKSLLLRCCNK